MNPVPPPLPPVRVASLAAYWAEVLVDCPGAPDLYTYRVPPGLAVQAGDIVSVPFGAQQLGGIVLAIQETYPDHLGTTPLRDIEAVISQGLFTPTYWHWLTAIATYYQTPLIQVIRAALPPGLLGKSQQRVRWYPERLPPGADTLLSPAAQAVLSCLQASKTGDYTWRYLQRQVRQARQGLHQLQQRGWVETYLEPPAAIRPKQQQAVTVTVSPADLPADTLTSRQREIIYQLWRQGGDLWLTDALQLCQTTTTTLKALAQKGMLLIQPRERLRTPGGATLPRDRPQTLTPDQAVALQTIQAQTQAATILLHGVTGSGKTEVYLQAIAPRLAQGQSALVLVPEIGLTPQLTDRFRARFGDRVGVYHSHLSDGERYDTWRSLLTGAPQVVIGTRSAIFLPLTRLGLIVLDEEHDGSFKQDQPAPTYHARTVAQWRSQLEACPLVLGSATPSLESWQAVNTPECLPPVPSGLPLAPMPAPTFYVSLPQRVAARPQPSLQVVDLRQEFQTGNRSMFSRPLQAALATLKAKQEQGILFIHRRGHSTFVSCRDCGYVMPCPDCDVSLTYHQPQAAGIALLRCHYCNFVQAQPPQCPSCGSLYLKNFGSGTQRVVQAIADQFPDLRCIRFDSDTTRTKGSHRALLTRFAQGEADLLVGTQMLTKGIDLPDVTLVGILAADGLLYMSDYRASERTLQTLLQAAGRAGRGDTPGQVILQTYNPEHPVIQAVQAHDYPGFAAAELELRRSLHFPPFCRLVLLRLSSPDAIAVQQAAEQLAAVLATPALGLDPATYEQLGPAPAPVLRVARRYRWRLLLKFPLEVPLPDLLSLRSHLPSTVSLTIDIDPLNLN